MKNFRINYSIKGVMTTVPIFVTIQAENIESITEEIVVKAVQEQSTYFRMSNGDISDIMFSL